MASLLVPTTHDEQHFEKQEGSTLGEPESVNIRYAIHAHTTAHTTMRTTMQPTHERPPLRT
eukprot:4932945-Pyramimonas_sp.AAC.3